jgi:hypothetical protein
MKQYKDILATNSTYKRCYESHPPLPIGEFLIYGGSCITPAVKDAEIYVGFDRAMSHSVKSYPWNEGQSILFPITDCDAPSDVEQTKKLIEWLALNLSSNKKIHLGCIGGHGRTGTILAALVNVMTGEKAATDYVRQHYCKKVVESSIQIDWLFKHFGITKAEPSKAHVASYKKGSTVADINQYVGLGKTWGSSVSASQRKDFELTPVTCDYGIWGSNAL